MRPLLAAVAVLACAGCADNAYYQTRALPMSADDSFSASERLFWSEDSDIYELPARPPARERNEDEGHRNRLDCLPPGQQLKAVAVATRSTDKPAAVGRIEAKPVAGHEDRPNLIRGSGTIPANPMFASADAETRGAREPLGITPAGSYEDRPRSQRVSGIDRVPASAMGGSSDPTGWCPPGKTFPPSDQRSQTP